MNTSFGLDASFEIEEVGKKAILIRRKLLFGDIQHTHTILLKSVQLPEKLTTQNHRGTKKGIDRTQWLLSLSDISSKLIVLCVCVCESTKSESRTRDLKEN